MNNTFINSFLFVLLPIVGIIIFIREGWKAGIRFFVLLILPLFLFVGGLYYFVDSLPDNSFRVLGIGIVLLSLGYLFAKFLVFYFNRQKAGKLILGEKLHLSSTNRFLSFVYFSTGLFMFVSSLDNPNENKSVFWGASFILMSVSVLVQEMEVFEIRENGIQKGWNFFLWSDIETVAWDHLLYKEKLNIKIKGVDAIKQVKVAWDVHLAVADYIKQMYPVNS